MTELKDWLNSINFTNSNNLIEEDPDLAISKYPSIHCQSLSVWSSLIAVMFANEMNKFPNSRQRPYNIHFYLNTLRKKKRFSPWLRKG